MFQSESHGPTVWQVKLPEKRTIDSWRDTFPPNDKQATGKHRAGRCSYPSTTGEGGGWQTNAKLFSHGNMGQYLNVPDPLFSFFFPANLPAAVSHSLSPALQFAPQHSAYPATVFRHSSKRKRERERERECAPQTALPVSASGPRPRCTVSQPSLKKRNFRRRTSRSFSAST